MNISMKYDVDRLKKRLNRTQREVIPLAASSAINKSLAKTLTQAKRQIMAQVGLPQNTFKRRFKTFKASVRRLTGSLWVGYKYGKSLSGLSPSQRKRQWAKYGVQSQPFTARMPSGHTGRFVRVQQTGSSKGSKGWSKGRPRTSSQNLPIVNIDTTKVRLPEALVRRVVKSLNPFLKKEFSRTFHREVGQRLNRLKRR